MNKNDEHNTDAWRTAAQRAADDLDMATRSRLNRARQRALAQLDAPAWRRTAAWLPAGSVTALVLLATLLWWRPALTPETAPLQAQDMEILLSGEELELYADLDFYLWLETESDAG